MIRWEALGNGIGVFVSEEHALTTDTLLLARFSLPKKGELCADFGTGSGAIPLLWHSWGSAAAVTAVELQPEAARLAEQSVEKNGLAETVSVLRGDLRDYKTLLPHQGFHLIVCNPPYFSSGEKSEGERGGARHDVTLTLEDLCAAAYFSLRHGGRLCLCFRAERLAEALELFRRNGLEPKRLRLVQSGPDKAPYLFLLECKKGGKTGLSTEPVLVLNSPNGAPTPELLELYGAYRNDR